MKSVLLTQFDGGMVNDPRTPATNVCRVSEHFDAFTDKHRLTPYRSAVSGDSSASTHQIANFLYANGILYGLGVINATGSGGPSAEPALYKNTDLTLATWTADTHGSAPTGGLPSNGSRSDIETAAFCWYNTTGKIYGARDTRYVWSITPGSANNPSELDTGATFSYCSNMLVHSKDDILYFGYDNKIASNNNGSWTAAALTLPSNYVITSIAEFGNFLAIGCRPKNRGRSKVYLWDRNSSLTTLSEVIDWGDGELYMLEELEGYLIGVSFEFATPSAISVDNQMMLKTRTAFRYYSGSGQAVKFEEFIGASIPSVQTSISLSKQKVNNRIIFPASIPIVTTGYQGIWSIGRNSSGQPFAVTLDRLLDNGTAVGGIYGALLLGDYLFASYTISSVFAMDKTDSTATYTASSIYETTINSGMPLPDRPHNTQLRAAALMYDPLPTGAQAILKYRVDGGAWTTILTETTANAVITEQVLDATGTQFKSGREYEFHIESTGGAVITALLYNYDVLQTLI